MQQPTRLVSDWYRSIQTLLQTARPYWRAALIFVGIVLAMIFPPVVTMVARFLDPAEFSTALGTVIEAAASGSEIGHLAWGVAVVAIVFDYFDLFTQLRERRDIVRTASIGVASLIVLSMGVDLLRTLPDLLLGWETVAEGLLDVLTFHSDMVPLATFGVALYSSLRLGHSPAAHRDTLLIVAAHAVVLVLLGEILTDIEALVGYGTDQTIVGAVTGYGTELLMMVPFFTLTAGVFGIGFAYALTYATDGELRLRTVDAGGEA